MKQLLECVPNFSEGKNHDIIKKISDQIELVEGVRLLHVDSGKAANRTVVTFAGEPGKVCEAAFQAVKKAASLIDMRVQKGEHPRIGATDVVPLVPLANVSMEETVGYARKLAERIGNELNIPTYCYEYAATQVERKNLANCRRGNYEALSERLASVDWSPDYGPAEFTESVARTGATAVGARNILVAYNINLNTKSTEIANAIASEIREKGRVKRADDLPDGIIIRDENGKPRYEPGILKHVKAIGWYIEDYGIAQISCNLTNIEHTSVHQVFEAAKQRAEARGIKVTGSELIGLIPLKAMLDAGIYILRKMNMPVEVPESEIIQAAVKYLGLDELGPFEPHKRIIEYLMEG